MSTSNYTNAQGNMGAFSKAKDLQQKILFVLCALNQGRPNKKSGTIYNT